jgi:hypothetical protein
MALGRGNRSARGLANKILLSEANFSLLQGAAAKRVNVRKKSTGK